jgi:hypothetical protein
LYFRLNPNELDGGGFIATLPDQTEKKYPTKTYHIKRVPRNQLFDTEKCMIVDKGYFIRSVVNDSPIVITLVLSNSLIANTDTSVCEYPTTLESTHYLLS